MSSHKAGGCCALVDSGIEDSEVEGSVWSAPRRTVRVAFQGYGSSKVARSTLGRIRHFCEGGIDLRRHRPCEVERIAPRGSCEAAGSADTIAAGGADFLTRGPLGDL